jgi:hypothetical protein
MSEAVGLTVSRLIRTRYGVHLPRAPSRGRWKSSIRRWCAAGAPNSASRRRGSRSPPRSSATKLQAPRVI